MLDVLVVGAGPVSLMLAGELSRRAVNFEVVESKPIRDRYCKALGVSPRSLELFDILGVLDEAHRIGMYFGGMNVVVDGQVTHKGPGQDGSLPYGFMALAQPDVEDLLEESLRRRGGSVQLNHLLVSLEQDADAVSATFADGSVKRARYLVGCDGAHSTVRKQLAIPFEGERFERTFVLGDVRLNWDRPHHENWQFIQTEDGELRNIVTVIGNPTGPGRYRISASIDDADTCPEHPDLEFLERTFGAALPEGVEMTDLRWSSRYSISHRLAERYRQGRVFLAGDAAHIHPPIGGLGMNTGLQDAFNLGWKLAAVCAGALPEEILKTYQDERRPVGEKVVAVTGARMRRAMGGPAEPEPKDFDTQLRIRYQPGHLIALSPEGCLGPRTGERMPSLELSRPRAHGRIRTAELLRDGRFHLFVHLRELSDYQSVVEPVLGDTVRCWEVREDGPDDVLNYLLDQASEWRGTFGAGAVLVRPDSVIAWRGTDSASLQSWLAELTRTAV